MAPITGPASTAHGSSRIQKAFTAEAATRYPRTSEEVSVHCALADVNLEPAKRTWNHLSKGIVGIVVVVICCNYSRWFHVVRYLVGFLFCLKLHLCTRVESWGAWSDSLAPIVATACHGWSRWLPWLECARRPPWMEWLKRQFTSFASICYFFPPMNVRIFRISDFRLKFQSWWDKRSQFGSSGEPKGTDCKRWQDGGDPWQDGKMGRESDRTKLQRKILQSCQFLCSWKYIEMKYNDLEMI